MIRAYVTGQVGKGNETGQMRRTMVTSGSLLLALATCVLLVLSQLLLKQSMLGADRGDPSTANLVLSMLGSGLFWLAVLSTALGAVLWLGLIRTTPISIGLPPAELELHPDGAGGAAGVQ